jgi:hypothetical protein
MVGVRLVGVAAFTVIANAGSAVLAWPSLTRMRMLENVPALPVPGVPFRRPLVDEKVAQVGLFCTLKVKVSPSGSLAVGVKLYALPVVTDVAGVPEMVGGRLLGVASATLMVKAASAALACPSLTLMMMFANVPALLGIPLKVPSVVENVAQTGLFWMLKVSASPSGSLAVGVKSYALPTVTEVGGVPEIVGARLVSGGSVTVIVNAARDAFACPSLTVITISAKVPTLAVLGRPESRPVVVEKLAQLGLLAMVKVSGSPSASAAEG